MRKIICLLLAVGIAATLLADVRVRAYHRSDGTYVQSHWRSDRDTKFWNNYSSWGNYNPYTFERGYRLPTWSDYTRRPSYYDYTYRPKRR